MINTPNIDYKEIFEAWKISLKPTLKQEELQRLFLLSSTLIITSKYLNESPHGESFNYCSESPDAALESTKEIASLCATVRGPLLRVI